MPPAEKTLQVFAVTRRLRIRVHGIVVAVVAAIALVGHAVDWPALATWGGMVPLSLPAAFCFLLLGSSQIEMTLGDLWNPMTHE